VEKLGDPLHRRLAVRAHDEGHWIGNHTFARTMPLGQQRDADSARNLDDRLLKPSIADYLAGHKHSRVLWNAAA
jgi:hypothetical protein